MRGKSVDKEFVLKFIQECAANGKNSPEEICEEAIHKMEEIDKQLKLRIKLADVLSFFGYKKKNTVIVQEEKLPEFKDVDKRFAQAICELAPLERFTHWDVITSSDSDKIHSREEAIFTLKTLAAMKVIDYTNNVIKCGVNFDKFIKYAREN